MTRSRRRHGIIALTTVTVLALAGCTGDDNGSDLDPEETLASAQEQLNETSGLRITLTSDDLPQGVSGLLSAEGVGTRAPAFEGSIKVRYGGFEPDVPVIAVDGKVFAQVPLTTGWSDIDPAEYGAPDPARLMDSDAGFSSLLPATTEVEKGRSVRGGANNNEILTEFSGTVPDSAVKNVIPSASGSFAATYTITGEGQLREAELTGVFYPDTEAMTYLIGFEDYGTEKDITAP